ncbi:transposable element Tcb1 transposase [Trichonephila clavipes]|nr:transposable element Tcb1 transposase [Trichonephila clavipes]
MNKAAPDRTSPKTEKYHEKYSQLFILMYFPMPNGIAERVTPIVTASIGKAISAATVHRRLHMNGLYARVPRVCVSISVQSRGARLKWCREHGNWTVCDWDNGSVTAVRYRDEVLEPIERFYAAAVGPTFVLKDDNARPHRGDIVDDYQESE